jgi:peptidyl-prolyl cis-trans isomerase SurA
MRYIARTLLVTLVCIIAVPALSAHAAEEPLDKIVAVVGGDIVLLSEINEFLRIELMRGGKDMSKMAPSELLEYQCKALKGMVDDRLLVAKAIKDSLPITAEAIEGALKQQLGTIRSRFPTKQGFLDQLKLEGTTERQLRDNLRDQMRRYLLRDQLQRKMGAEITVSFSEVERFYAAHKDSLPEVQPSVTIAHITRVTKPGDSALTDARQRLNKALARLKNGETFAALATGLSQDPATAPEGGDLGYFGRGLMFPEFEAASFKLDSGEVSAPVMTEAGLHLIQNLGFRGDEVRVRHILAAARPTDHDRIATRDSMKSIYSRIQKGADFGYMARTFSQDPKVRETGGRLGPLPPTNLPPSISGAIATLNVGEISAPFESQHGTFHIVKLVARVRAHTMSLIEDRRKLEEAVRQQKLFEVLSELLASERKKTYVEIRFEGCDTATTTR